MMNFTAFRAVSYFVRPSGEKAREGSDDMFGYKNITDWCDDLIRRRKEEGAKMITVYIHGAATSRLPVPGSMNNVWLYYASEDVASV